MSPAKLWTLLKETVNNWLADKASRMGAALAYYSVFSVTPLLLVAIGIAGVFFGEQAAKQELHTQLAETIGPQVAGAVEEMLGNVHRNRSGVIGSLVGVVILFFGASGVFVELQDALNTIWKVKPEDGARGLLRDRIVSFLVVVSSGCLLLVSLAASALVVGFQENLRARMPGGDWFWWIGNLVVSFTVVALLFAMIYKLLPDTTVRWRDVWPGAVLAALLFTLGKYLIGLYLAKGAVASAFGAAGSVIVLVVWVYYSSQILLFGAEFSRAYSARAAGGTTAPATDGRLAARGPGAGGALSTGANGARSDRSQGVR
jgi:membrane protein